MVASHVCNTSDTLVVGKSEREHGLADGPAVSKLMHYLIAESLGPGNGEWMGRLRSRFGKRQSGSFVSRTHSDLSTEAEETPAGMIMYGDFGGVTDDEKALAMAIAMRNAGLIGDMLVIANLNETSMRARLAKGTANALGAHDVRVARGFDSGKRAKVDVNNCPYLAPISEIETRSGHELALEAIQEAKLANTTISIVVNSALTDLAALLKDPRWARHAPDVVTHIVLMGQIHQNPDDGVVSLDETSQNFKFDLAASREVWDHLQQRDAEKLKVFVVTRHAASVCQLDKRAFDCNQHPIALRLRTVAEPSLQRLWVRCHMTEEERVAAHDTLPMRCDVEWFRSEFLDDNATKQLDSSHEVWSLVKGFNEYDGLATLVAATARFPYLFETFFKPSFCSKTNTHVIGRSKAEPKMTDGEKAAASGITDGEKAAELLHDLLVGALAPQRLKKGFKVEIRVSPLVDDWQLAILHEPASGLGPDSWILVLTPSADAYNGVITTIPVMLNQQTEGILWRLAHSLGDHDERILPDNLTTKLNMRHRKVRDITAVPYYVTQAAWTELREELDVRPDDVWVTGYPCSGNSIIQLIVRTLRHGGDAAAALAKGKYAAAVVSCIDMDVSRNVLGIDALDRLAPEDRVFTTHHMPENLPCGGSGESGDLLPPGIRVIHPVRNPHSCCASVFWQYTNQHGTREHQLDLAQCEAKGAKLWLPLARACATAASRRSRHGLGSDPVRLHPVADWVNAFISSNDMPWGGWFEQNMAWWEAHQKHPEQVLWITFEECVEQPETAVRRVAEFLGLSPSEEVIQRTAHVITFNEMRKVLDFHPKLHTGQLSVADKFGDFVNTIRNRLFVPCRQLGMELRDTHDDSAPAPA